MPILTIIDWLNVILVQRKRFDLFFADTERNQNVFFVQVLYIMYIV